MGLHVRERDGSGRFSLWFAVLVCAVFVVGVVSASVGVGYWVSTVQCANIADLSGRDTRFSMSGGCEIYDDGRWVSERRWLYGRKGP